MKELEEEIRVIADGSMVFDGDSINEEGQSRNISIA